MLERLWQAIEGLMLLLGYPGITLLVAAEVIFPPIPSEVVLPLAGALAARGVMDPLGVVAAATVGSVLGASALYSLARWGSRALVLRLVRHYGRWLAISEADLDAADRFFRRWGYLAVLLGRIVPLVRSLISLPAGHARMPVASFVAFTALGSLAWNALLVGSGFLLGESWPLVSGWIRQYEHIVLGLLAALLIVVVIRLYLRRRRLRRQPTLRE